jgi:hypothetical protein
MIYTMEEVLGRWPDGIQSEAHTGTSSGSSSSDRGAYYMTNVLDTHLKKNVALALSVNQIAVLNFPGLACLTCTLYHARAVEEDPPRLNHDVDAPGNQYIINLRTGLAEQHGVFQLPGPSTSQSEPVYTDSG